jgi:hypothetical protein
MVTNISCLSNHLLEQEKLAKNEELFSDVPICGANLSTPVVDKAYYITEIHYRIGDRLYIENAD